MLNNKNDGKYCRLCNGADLNLLVDLGKLPISHQYSSNNKPTEEKYAYAVHSCITCGLHQILNPISEEILYRDYNYCFTSWKPEPHRDSQIELIKRLVSGKKIFEIGSNDGTFLGALKEKGFGECVGVEPNPLSGKMARENGYAVYEDWLCPEVCSRAVKQYGLFDNVVSRHVIEHIADLQQFFSCIEIVLKPGGYLILDTPDCGTAIGMGDASILWEEHVNYFTETTMQAMLRGFGYEIVALKRYLFSGESLTVIARQIPRVEKNVVRFNREAAGVSESNGMPAGAYSNKMAKYAAELRTELTACKQAGDIVVLFGVGARGVMTVNALGLKDSIDVAFDDQAEKQGMYMPGSGLAIRDPISVRDYSSPLTCLLAVNNENEDAVKERMIGLTRQNIKFSSLFSPKDIWRELDELRG